MGCTWEFVREEDRDVGRAAVSFAGGDDAVRRVLSDGGVAGAWFFKRNAAKESTSTGGAVLSEGRSSSAVVLVGAGMARGLDVSPVACVSAIVRKKERSSDDASERPEKKSKAPR